MSSNFIKKIYWLQLYTYVFKEETYLKVNLFTLNLILIV